MGAFARALLFLSLATTLLAMAACQGGSAPVLHSLEEGVQVTFDQGAYPPGELITITVSLRNGEKGPVTLAHNPPLVEVRMADREVPIWLSPPGLAETTLKPGASVRHEIVWDQRDMRGMPVPRGEYTITVHAEPKDRGPFSRTAEQRLVLA